MTSSEAGLPDTLGVRAERGGINVAVYAPDAQAVAICLFDAADRETHRWRLPARTGPVWHGFFPGIAPGIRYGLRAYGPWQPEAGHRFNPAKLLLDPWATAIDRPLRLHPALFDGDRPKPDDTAALMPKAIVGTRPADPLADHSPATRLPADGSSVDHAPAAHPPVDRPAFDWDRQVIYELHVRGFTATHPEIPAEQRGTFAGLAHPAAIAHLTRLGVTTVEIMPCAAWIDERHLPPLNLADYWGYNPVGFLAPDPRLAPGGWTEIRAAVDALHAAGLHVVLDVVLNHSGESDEHGPTLSLRGLGDRAYYRLNDADPALFANDAGCGNVLAMDRPGPLRLGLDALRAWATLGGFDGFRLDLAATLARRPSGFDRDAPFLLAVEQDPILSRLAFIAEPWDIGPGGYQLGAFPPRWGEWNDRFRDDVRRFWRGDAGTLGALTTRVAGSADVFPPPRPLSRGINYVTAHDGFTLADLVAFTTKRNEANGENNRDGSSDNLSWNNGVEGASADPAVLAARARDQRAVLAILLLSRGTPMLSMGDELGRSQNGNNNAYAQDNASSWIDWAGADASLIGFTAELAAIRRRFGPLFDGRALADRATGGGASPAVSWLRPDGAPMQSADWDRPDNRTLVALLDAEGRRAVLVFHGGAEPVGITLPDLPAGRTWQALLPLADGRVPPRSVGVFEAVPSASGRTDADGGRPDSRAIGSADGDTETRETSTSGGGTIGVPDNKLDDLALRAGIEPVWWDIAGGRHPVSAQTKRALLAAMRLPAATRGDLADSLDRLTGEQARPLPPVITARTGATPPITLNAPQPNWLTLLGEDGTLRRLPVEDGGLLLPALPAGRHRLLNEDRPEHACHLIIAPAGCHAPAGMLAPPLSTPPPPTPAAGTLPASDVPPALRAHGQVGERCFGIAAHLYTLRSDGDGGIGDFTTLARLAAAAGRAGATIIGLNPLHALFPHDRRRTSPYQPSDRRFLDPIYVDTAAVDNGRGGALRSELVDYAGVWARKRAALQRMEPCADPLPDALRQFATFCAIADHTGTSDWRNWPAELRHPADPGVARFAAAHRTAVGFHATAQSLAEQQFAAAARSAAADGVAFYRDLAVGAAPDGAEAWAAQDTLMTGASIGAPPDPFALAGQIWGLPPPDPVRMRRDGYAAFDALLCANMRHAGALRIDHVMGLRRLFVVPAGAGATEGAYIAYPADDLLALTALRSRQARCAIVGEDLGTVPEGMTALLAANNILSYSVLWFEREGNRPRPAAQWRRRAAACVSTHDLPTLAGWWQGVDIAERRRLALLDDDGAALALAERQADKRALLDQLVEHGLLSGPANPDVPLPEAVAAAVHGFVSATPALLMLIQADDLAGEATAVNLPGTGNERPNWQRRLAPDVNALLQTPLARAILAAVRDRAAR